MERLVKEGQAEGEANSPKNGQSPSERSEPVRSRWTPKPEQILILESIFNSGMVNPPKDETVRIRKLLEKFGSVGDANVFYWFQNRRSRTRRRQRQIQAGLLTTAAPAAIPVHHQASPAVVYHEPSNCFATSSFNPLVCSSSSSSSGDDLFSTSQPMGLPDFDHSSSIFSNLHYQSGGSIAVFINGVATEVPRGPFNMRAIFGENAMLLHSSGVPVAVTNEYGVVLQMGEIYFLVSGPT